MFTAGKSTDKKPESKPMIPWESFKAGENESVVVVSPSLIAYTRMAKVADRDEIPTADIVVYDTVRKKIIHEVNLGHPAQLIAMPDRSEEVIVIYINTLQFAVYNCVTGEKQEYKDDSRGVCLPDRVYYSSYQGGMIAGVSPGNTRNLSLVSLATKRVYSIKCFDIDGIRKITFIKPDLMVTEEFSDKFPKQLIQFSITDDKVEKTITSLPKLTQKINRFIPSPDERFCAALVQRDDEQQEIHMWEIGNADCKSTVVNKDGKPVILKQIAVDPVFLQNGLLYFIAEDKLHRYNPITAKLTILQELEDCQNILAYSCSELLVKQSFRWNLLEVQKSDLALDCVRQIPEFKTALSSVSRFFSEASNNKLPNVVGGLIAEYAWKSPELLNKFGHK